MSVGTLNRTGKPYVGSYDIWDKKQDIRSPRYSHVSIHNRGSDQEAGSMEINTSDHKNHLGSFPIAEDIQTKLGKLAYHPGYATTLKIRYPYLAARQGTRSAVVPIHTKAERTLFKIARP